MIFVSLFNNIVYFNNFNLFTNSNQKYQKYTRKSKIKIGNINNM